MELVLEAVSRLSEVLRLGPQPIKNGHIKIERLKGSDEVDIPLTPELPSILAVKSGGLARKLLG